MNKQLFEILGISPLDGYYTVESIQPALDRSEVYVQRFRSFKVEALTHLGSHADLCDLIATPAELNWVLNKYDKSTGIEILKRLQQRPSPDDTATEITERALTRAAKAAIVSHCSGAPSGATAVVGIAAGATTLPTRITDALRSYIDSYTEQDENNASCNTRLNKIVDQPNSLYTILSGIEPIKALAALSILRQTFAYDIWANQQLSLEMTAASSSVGKAFFDYMADEFSLLPQNRTLAISVLPGSTKHLANIFVDNLYGTAEINEKLALGCHINLFQHELTNYVKGVIDETASDKMSPPRLDEETKVQTFVDEYEFEPAELLEMTLPNEETPPSAHSGISPSKPTEPSEEKKTPSGVKNPLQPHDWLKEGGALKTIFPSTDGQSPQDAQVKKSRERIAEFCKAMEDLNIVCQEQTLKGNYVDHKNRTIIEAYTTVTEATKIKS